MPISAVSRQTKWFRRQQVNIPDLFKKLFVGVFHKYYTVGTVLLYTVYNVVC